MDKIRQQRIGNGDFSNRLVKGMSLDAVVCCNVNGSYSAVEMMINKGHCKIGIIAGPKDNYTAQERLNGYI